MRSRSDAYKLYLAEIGRYLELSESRAEELRLLEKEWRQYSAKERHRAENECQELRNRVRELGERYTRVAQMLKADDLKDAGALIPERVRPSDSGGRFVELVAEHDALVRQIEQLAGKYRAERASIAVGQSRASHALEARRRVLSEVTPPVQEFPVEQQGVKQPERRAGCLAPAVLLVGLLGIASAVGAAMGTAAAM